LGKFDKIWAQLRQNLGKIKVLHPQKHPISYGYDSHRGYATKFGGINIFPPISGENISFPPNDYQQCYFQNHDNSVK